MSNNKNDIINRSSDGADGFDKLMKTLYSFLNADARKNGVGTSKITSYIYKDDNTNTDPHTITDGKSQDKNSKIIEDFSAPLNVIKDIIDNNYMKLNDITISNDYYPLNSHKKVPALTDYQALTEYWRDGEASACNGACVGYCSGNCHNATDSEGTVGTLNGYSNPGCSSCGKTCSGKCSTGCSDGCLSCSGGCWSEATQAQNYETRPQFCHASCGNSCGAGCHETCSEKCSSCTGCQTGCGGECNDGCGGECKTGCKNHCGGGCENKCGSTCGGTCMFGSSAKPIEGGKNS